MADHPTLPFTDALDWSFQIRLLEALLFAATEPMKEQDLADRLGPHADLPALLAEVERFYQPRGVNLVRVAGGWAFRTAADLSKALNLQHDVPRKPTRAALEVMAIIAYNQPVTRAEIESIRGVATSRGTLDMLLEAGWIRPGKRRRTPGRPVTWLTTDRFLSQFGLESLADLPGLDELKAAGLLDTRPAGLIIPGLEQPIAPDEDDVAGLDEL